MKVAVVTENLEDPESRRTSTYYVYEGLELSSMAHVKTCWNFGSAQDLAHKLKPEHIYYISKEDFDAKR